MALQGNINVKQKLALNVENKELYMVYFNNSPA